MKDAPRFFESLRTAQLKRCNQLNLDKYAVQGYILKYILDWL